MSSREVVLGISAFYHDSAAALLVDGTIAAAAQEERFSRKKHDERFPARAIAAILSDAGVSPSEVRTVAFYDKPFLKFERLLETFHATAPRGFRNFMTVIPVWVQEKLFMKMTLRKELRALGIRPERILFPEHHLSHAASAFFASPFEKAAILTVDGVGEWATTTLGLGEGNRITVLRQLDFPHSLGLLYSAFTQFCGFKVNSGEYKLMGLAPYGRSGSRTVEEFKEKILSELVDLREDGSLLLNMEYFDYVSGFSMCRMDRWEALFGFQAREPESLITDPFMDLALAIQEITEESIFRMARTVKDLTGAEHLVLAGGVALNCVASGKLLAKKWFKDLWIQPAAGDAGGAVGAALAAWHISDGRGRDLEVGEAGEPGGVLRDRMRGAYLGPEFGPSDVDKLSRQVGAKSIAPGTFEQLCDRVADLLDQGQVVGWFQGRMEFGPRALGNRSILGDARNPEMQKKLNLKIKFREGFRPFAPSVLEEDLSEYFELDRPSPYMLLVAPVVKSRCKAWPEGYETRPLGDRLYFTRSDIPAVTHIDYSARIQSVSRETNPRYWELIRRFKAKTGFGVIVNTSFNVRGEPIVCTPEDAWRCFMRTEMDALVIGDFLFLKSEQPPWRETEAWQSQYTLD